MKNYAFSIPEVYVSFKDNHQLNNTNRTLQCNGIEIEKAPN